MSSEISSAKKKGRQPKIVEDWAPAFIGALVEGESVTDAANRAGVHPTMPYKRRLVDEEFKVAWKEACDIGTEFLEQEAARRAYHGTLKPVFHKGVECGAIREYSDTLMIFLLKGRKPHVYRDGVEDGNIGRGLTLNVNIVQVEQEKPKVIIDSEVLPLEVQIVEENK